MPNLPYADSQEGRESILTGHWTPGILEDIEYLEYKRTLNTKPPTEVTHASSQYKNDRQSISGFGLQLENDERDH